MDPRRRERAETTVAICRLLLQAAALEKSGYGDLAEALRAQADRMRRQMLQGR